MIKNLAKQNLPLDNNIIPEKNIRIGNLFINVFNDKTNLNRSVAKNICQEMRKGGLVVLPSDSTHGNEEGEPPGEIYQFLDALIAKTKVPSTLNVTHMDELEGGNTSFSDSIREWLPTLVKRLGNRFHAIDIKNFDAYKDLMKEGPRVIVGGIGAATPPRVAYIGEETKVGKNNQREKDLLKVNLFPVSLPPKKDSQILNTEPKRIKLREEESKRRNCTHAFTMGMNSFKPANKNLQTVILTAKGENKASAVEHALEKALSFADVIKNDYPDILNRKNFRDYIQAGYKYTDMAKSACGQILKQFASSKDQNGPKLVLNLDQELFKKLPDDLVARLAKI